jgi:hypothetical protein
VTSVCCLASHKRLLRRSDHPKPEHRFRFPEDLTLVILSTAACWRCGICSCVGTATLPEELTGLRFRVCFRGQTVELDIGHDLVRVRAISPQTEAIRLHVDSKAVSSETGKTLEVKLERAPLYVDAP